MGERVLAIDTATVACSVALFEDNALIASDYGEIGRGHAERLIPAIALLPDRGKADRILVNCGPGSFTGVRVGISAARALALAWRWSLRRRLTSLTGHARLASRCWPDMANIFCRILPRMESLWARLPRLHQNKRPPR